MAQAVGVVRLCFSNPKGLTNGLGTKFGFNRPPLDACQCDHDNHNWMNLLREIAWAKAVLTLCWLRVCMQTALKDANVGSK